MPGQIKYHLDENVSNAVAESLRRRGINVTTTPGQNLNGASDRDQLAFAREQQRVIFTHDDDFLNCIKPMLPTQALHIVTRVAALLEKLSKP